MFPITNSLKREEEEKEKDKKGSNDREKEKREKKIGNGLEGGKGSLRLIRGVSTRKCLSPYRSEAMDRKPA